MDATTTTTHRIDTRSTAAFVVAGMNTDGTVFRIGYAHSAAAAATRVRRHNGAAAAARIVDGAAVFVVTATARPGRVIDRTTGAVTDGTVTTRAIAAA